MAKIGEPQSQAVKLLAEMIRLDTSNPPGNEEIAVQFLEGELAKEGIRSEVFMPAPRRANILARLKGKEAGRPVVLLGHLDVVPAHDEGWVEPPFSGAVRDGFIYGRGAIDMKSQVENQSVSAPDYDYYGVDITPPAGQWTFYQVPFSSMVTRDGEALHGLYHRLVRH